MSTADNIYEQGSRVLHNSLGKGVVTMLGKGTLHGPHMVQVLFEGGSGEGTTATRAPVWLRISDVQMQVWLRPAFVRGAVSKERMKSVPSVRELSAPTLPPAIAILVRGEGEEGPEGRGGALKGEEGL
mgnify:CR=1 FL=1